MLAIDGYYPLSAFFRLAKRNISKKLWDYWNNANSSEDPSGGDGDWTAPVQPKRTEFWYENIEIAAQFLVHDVIAQAGNGSRPYVMRPDGSKVAIQLKATEPAAGYHERHSDYENHRNWRIQDAVVRRNELVFGLDTFKDAFWLEYFARDRIFKVFEPSYSNLCNPNRRFFSLLNWGQGTIDLSTLRAVVAAREHFQSAHEVLLRAGCAPPRLLDRVVGGDSDVVALLRMFEPYDGCPIILPEVWARELEKPIAPDKLGQELEYPACHPTEAILAILDSEGSIGKENIKSRILTQYPGTSSRKFDHYWRLVAAERPHIQKAGPKSKRGEKSKRGAEH